MLERVATRCVVEPEEGGGNGRGASIWAEDGDRSVAWAVLGAEDELGEGRRAVLWAEGGLGKVARAVLWAEEELGNVSRAVLWAEEGVGSVARAVLWAEEEPRRTQKARGGSNQPRRTSTNSAITRTSLASLAVIVRASNSSLAGVSTIRFSPFFPFTSR